LSALRWLFLPSSRDTLREDVRFRILRLIDDNPQLSQRALSQELGVSLGAVNYCLKALITKGQVKVRNFHASDKKLRYAYILTPQGASEKTTLTGRFLKRKLVEYQALKSEIEQIEQEMSYGADMVPRQQGK
jgi:EPS-associated MarR family transcriptional regulator